MRRRRDNEHSLDLDALFAHAERLHTRARASLDRKPVLDPPAARPSVPRPEEGPPAWAILEPKPRPQPRRDVPAPVRPRWAEVEQPQPAPEPLPARRADVHVDSVLDRAADAAAEVRGSHGAIVRLYGERGSLTPRGLSVAETQMYSVGPPPAGPRVRALAIGYDPVVPAPKGLPPIHSGLAVPIQAGDEIIGFVSIFSRSADGVFDEAQGWELLAIAASVGEALAEAPAALREEQTSRPGLRTALLAIAGIACVAAPAMMAAGIHSPLRVAAALALLALAPGAAAVPLFGGRSAPLELGLVAGTSLAVSALIAELTLWAGAWSPWWATAALAGVSFASILPQLGVRWQRAWEGAAV